MMAEATVMQNTNDAEFSDYYALLKPRVMTLVVFTAAVGLIVAPGSMNPVLVNRALSPAAASVQIPR